MDSYILPGYDYILHFTDKYKPKFIPTCLKPIKNTPFLKIDHDRLNDLTIVGHILNSKDELIVKVISNSTVHFYNLCSYQFEYSFMETEHCVHEFNNKLYIINQASFLEKRKFEFDWDHFDRQFWVPNNQSAVGKRLFSLFVDQDAQNLVCSVQNFGFRTRKFTSEIFKISLESLENLEFIDF